MANVPLRCNPYLTLNNITKHFCKAEVSDKDLIVLDVNARSLSKNLDSIREIIQHMPTEHDVIGITETKINQYCDVSSLSLPGYNFFHVNTMISAGGVGVYVKTSSLFSARNDLLISLDRTPN